jgi:AcrR family transcriptional regulator
MEAAQKTREGILDAAVKLHGLGILDFDALAAEANVSPATVRKYFPSREELYAGCTTWAMRSASVPDLGELAGIVDDEERLRTSTVQLHALYRALFGQIWTGYTIQGTSAVLTRELDELTKLQDAVTEIVLAGWPRLLADDPEARGIVRGLLSYLSYNALVREGRLSFEQATDRIIEMLVTSLRSLQARSRKEGAAV